MQLQRALRNIVFSLATLFPGKKETEDNQQTVTAYATVADFLTPEVLLLLSFCFALYHIYLHPDWF